MRVFFAFLLAIAVMPGANAATALPWTRMIWLPANFGGSNIEHAGLMVQVQLDGSPINSIMQLDTGCDADLLYALPYDQLGRNDTHTGRDQVLLSGTVAGTHFESERFNVRRGAVSFFRLALMSFVQRVAVWKNRPILLGTIGAAFFESRVLLLDFVSERMAILGKGEPLPPAIARSIDFAPIEYRNRKIFIGLSINGSKYQDLFFDTGSSAMALMTTVGRWLEWTDGDPGDPKNRVIVAPAWNEYGRWIGAPIKGSLCVGGACLNSPLAFFESKGLATLDFDHYPFRTSGLIGNVLFDGRYTVVLDLPNKRFGLFAGSLARTSQAGSSKR